MRNIFLTFFVPLFLLSFSNIHWQTSYNLNLLGTYDLNFTEGNYIWGLVDPQTEEEYALVGLVDGFSCVNVSNPANPVEEFFIADLSSTWRDVKTWGNYAYVTTEANAGLLIVDLNDRLEILTGMLHSLIIQLITFQLHLQRLIIYTLMKMAFAIFLGLQVIMALIHQMELFFWM